MTYLPGETTRRSDAGAGRVPPQPVGLGRLGGAARRCSSLAYSSSSTPRSSRLARLAPQPQRGRGRYWDVL